MGSLRKGLIWCMALGLVALFPATVLAADGVHPAAWPSWHLQAAFLGLLAPAALMLLALGATPAEHASDTVAGALSALVAGVVAYCICGFAFQFGGIALRENWPGLHGLAAEWSPIDPSLGWGWGAIGLRGFFLLGPAATPDGYALAAVQLPAVAVAILVPVLALARRVGRPILLAVAALVGGVLYPLVGNWVWGGGWLALLGGNAGLGHGFVDLGGSATLNLLGAGVALCGILLLEHRVAPAKRRQAIELPPVHFPLVMLIGSLLAPIGWVSMVLANPLVPGDMPVGLVALNLVLAALGGAAPGLFYSWLATGRADALLAARGMIAGLAAASASCAFVPPWAALLVGLLAGLLLPLVLYAVEHRLHWHDPNAILSTHGLPGLLGVLWLAFAADGRWGVGWNGIGEWGVSGWLAGPGSAADAPGQLLAQLAGVGSILLLAVLGSGILFGVVRIRRGLTALREAPQPGRARRARRRAT